MPARPADEDFLPFDHPVDELPRLLATLERPAVRTRDQTEEKRPAAGPSIPWRLKVRRFGLGALAATGALFLVLQLGGFLPGVFFVHLPLLAVVAALVVGGTAERVPKGTPQFKNPVNWALLTAIGFFLVGGTLLNFANTEPERASVYLGFYIALGVIVLDGVVWVLARSRIAAAAARRRSGSAEETVPTREALVAACREVLRKIARNAPPGARATGWLDLGGPEQRHKLVSHDAKGWRYRDVWWRLRLPWEDGVRLRLAGIEQLRVRPDGQRRESDFLLLVNLAVDPRRWRTEPGPLQGGVPGASGSMKVEAFEVTPSRVSARVVSDRQELQPADLVALIQALEGRIRPVAAASASGSGVGGEA